MPVLALMVSVGLAWQSYSARGVPVEIIFQNASGVTAGETTLRFRDVVIGTVEDVSFTPDLTNVVVHARVNKDVAPYLDADASFWVVRPKVSTRGITGLSTVLSGVCIEGAWDQKKGAAQTTFTGADGPPLVQPGRDGKRITLITDDGVPGWRPPASLARHWWWNLRKSPMRLRPVLIALHNLPDTLWADDPVRGVTMALARSLDEASNAVVAPEPWPLDAPAGLRVEVRVERMLARADGQFELTGQYAYYVPGGSGRGVMDRFAISVPVSADGADGVAKAAGAATAVLAAQILGRLSR